MMTEVIEVVRGSANRIPVHRFAQLGWESWQVQ
jgi:hypothetical protein